MPVLSRNNQITVPSYVRKLKGWGPDTKVDVVIDERGIVRIVTPAEASTMLAEDASDLARIRETTRRGLGRARS